MRFLRKLIDKNRSLYHEEGSKFHKMWPLFDAMETFLFAPGNTTPKEGQHVRDYIDLKRRMSLVILALVPCLLFSIYNTGYQHYLAWWAMTTRAFTAGVARRFPICWIWKNIFLLSR